MTITTNPVRRVEGLILDDFQAPLGDYLTAQAEQSSVETPLQSFGRIREINEAAGLTEELEELNRQIGLPVVTPPDRPALTPVLSPEEASERAAAQGLKFDKPTRSRVVDIMIERKKAENIRQSIIRRSSGDLGTGALGLGVAFAVQAADPINIASAFVPVVREARFLQIARAAGPVRARLARGAVEGTVGAAIVEPVVLTAATQEQADYDMMDSLLNVAFGTALGGGLHVGGGAASDVFARATGRQTLAQRIAQAPHEVREAALRTAVGQIADGRTVEIESLIDARLLESTSLSTQRAAPGLDDFLATSRGPGPRQRGPIEQEPATLVPVTAGRAKSFNTEEAAFQAAQKGGTDLRVTERPEGGFSVLKRSEAEPLREPQGRVQEFKTKRQAEKFIDRVLPAEKANLAVVPFGPVGGRKFAVLRNASAAEVKAIEAQPDLVRFPDVERDRVTQRQPTALLAGENRPTLEQLVAKTVDHGKNPRKVALADFVASEQAEEAFQAIPVDESAQTAQQFVDDAIEQAEETRKALGVTDGEFAKIFAEIDDQVSEAQALGKAARAAAICELRL